MILYDLGVPAIEKANEEDDRDPYIKARITILKHIHQIKFAPPILSALQHGSLAFEALVKSQIKLFKSGAMTDDSPKLEVVAKWLGNDLCNRFMQQLSTADGAGVTMALSSDDVRNALQGDDQRPDVREQVRRGEINLKEFILQIYALSKPKRTTMPTWMDYDGELSIIASLYPRHRLDQLGEL